MNRLGGQLLARSAFTGDQNGGIVCRDFSDRLKNSMHAQNWCPACLRMLHGHRSSCLPEPPARDRQFGQRGTQFLSAAPRRGVSRAPRWHHSGQLERQYFVRRYSYRRSSFPCARTAAALAGDAHPSSGSGFADDSKSNNVTRGSHSCSSMPVAEFCPVTKHFTLILERRLQGRGDRLIILDNQYFRLRHNAAPFNFADTQRRSVPHQRLALFREPVGNTLCRRTTLTWATEDRGSDT